MYKTTLTAMTVAVAGVFMAAGSAGASIADWEFNATVGNTVDFDVDNGSWDPRSSDPDQDTTWGEVPEDDWDYNDPRLRGDPTNYESFWQPLQGEAIYSPDADVFDLDPWHVGPGLSGLRPSGVSEDIQFAGIWEFQLNGPTNGGDSVADLENVLDGYGSLPANFNSSWILNLHNRGTTSDQAGTGVSTAATNWEFDLNQQFDELDDDWSTEPLTAWAADSVHSDTWSGFQLLQDGNGDLTNRGYMLLATNNTDLLPWTSSSFAIPYSDWDTFTDSGTDADYYHTGVIGTEGSGRLEVVPEPASMTLLGLGLAGFATRRFMSRKKA